jgi:hypothetical protein
VAAPFVTAPTYTVRPDLTRLGQLPAHVRDPGPASLVRLDADAPRALAHALRELTEAPAAVRAVDPRADGAVLRAAAWALARALAAEGDPRVALEGDALVCRWLGVRVDADGRCASVPLAADAPLALAALAPAADAWLATQAATPSGGATLALDALALALQEDLVVLTRGGTGGRAASGGRAAYLNVVAPSGWDPGAHAGSSFAALHAPVPQRAPLDAAAGPLVAALVTRGPFVRHVWSLAPDDALGRHLHRVPLPAAVAPERLVYRVERQTTLPVPEADAGVFLIRVFTTPLAQVVADPAQRAALASAVGSMDEALLDYKGLRGGRAALLDWLGAG